MARLLAPANASSFTASNGIIYVPDATNYIYVDGPNQLIAIENGYTYVDENTDPLGTSPASGIYE